MLGDAIRERRQGLGLSMREAARRIGISTGYLVELEHGRNPTTGRAPMPSPTVLAGIGRALDVDLAALLDLAGVTPRRSAHMLLVQMGADGDRPASRRGGPSRPPSTSGSRSPAAATRPGRCARPPRRSRTRRRLTQAGA